MSLAEQVPARAKFLAIRWLFAAVIVLCLPSVARAEWLWGDTPDVKREFEGLVTTNLSQQCQQTNSEPFGYQSAYVTPKGQIGYEMVLRLDKACFDALVRRLRRLKTQKRLALRNKIPTSVADFYNADGGPTIIFHFSASELDLKDLERAGKYIRK